MCCVSALRKQALQCLVLHCAIFLYADNLMIPARFLPPVDEKNTLFVFMPLVNRSFKSILVYLFSSVILLSINYASFLSSSCLAKVLAAAKQLFVSNNCSKHLVCPSVFPLSSFGDGGLCLWMGT